MKQIFYRLLIAAALTIAALIASSSARAQQSDAEPAPATPRPQNPLSIPSDSPATNQSSESDNQTQDVLVFTGRILQGKDALVLNDPVTKMKYSLDNQAKAKHYLGKQVKITGKLDMKSNTIRIDNIEPLL